MAPDTCTISLLGTVEVRLGDGDPVLLRGRQLRAVLVALALAPDQTVHIDHLIDRLWPFDAPDSALTTVRAYVSRLRRLMGPGPPTSPGAAGDPVGSDVDRAGTRRVSLIEIVPGGYRLAVPPDAVDAIRFDRLRHDAAVALGLGGLSEAVGRFDAALALWRGPALGEFVYDEGFALDARYLEDARLAAVTGRVDALLGLGRGPEALAELSSLVAAHPVRERFYEQLMIAQEQAGRRPEALRTYERARGVLAEELGLEPGSQLRSLEQWLLGNAPRPEGAVLPDRTVRPASGPPAPGRSDHASTTRLPAAISSFVGRVDEVREVLRLVASHRLVSLLGDGGAGKTRLALAVATAVAGRPQGPPAVFVDLSAATGPDEVTTATATALGLREDPGRPVVDLIVDALGDRALLLVVDNCEHVCHDAALLIQRLLVGCPAVGVLVTSRRRLGLTGEIIWTVPPLGLPELGVGPAALASSDAVALFVERARAVRSDWEPDQSDLVRVASVCRALDGVPLAIELAAALTRLLGLDELLSRLPDRLDVLGRPGPPARHRSLRDAMDWSFGLLSPAAQSLLAALSVFTGPFTLDAVVAVAHPTLEDSQIIASLAELLDSSLLHRLAIDGPGRYRLPETVRLYGAELLGEAEAEVRERQVEFVCGLVRRSVASFGGPDVGSAMAELDLWAGDLGMVVDLLVREDRRHEALMLGGDLWRWWDQRFLVAEGRVCLDRILAMGGTEPARVACLLGASKLAWMADDIAVAEVRCREGLDALDHGDSPGLESGRLRLRAELLTRQAELARDAGRGRSEVDHAAGAARRMFADLGDRAGQADAQRVMALAAWDAGDLEEARRLAEDCRRWWDEASDAEGSAGVRALLGGLAADRGSLDEALVLHEESRTRFDQLGEPWGAAQATWALAECTLRAGRPGPAHDLAQQALSRYRTIGSTAGAVEALVVRARCELRLGRSDAAMRSADEAVGMAAGVGGRPALVAGITWAEVLLDSGHPEAARSAALGALADGGDDVPDRLRVRGLLCAAVAGARAGDELVAGESPAERLLSLLEAGHLAEDQRGLALEALADLDARSGQTERADVYRRAAAAALAGSAATVPGATPTAPVRRDRGATSPR